MTHPIRKHALLIVASLLVFIAGAAAQTASIDTKLAAQYFRQLKQNSDRDAGKTWGLALYGPILFVDPRTGNVVANQADLEHRLTAQGWSLELANGWEVVPAERQGDVTIRKR